MKKIFLIILVLSINHLSAQSQIIIDDISLDAEFAAQVKSVDEFMARFNGEESKIGIANDSMSRRNNLLSLFDFKYLEKNISNQEFKTNILEFCNFVERENITLKLLESQNIAQAVCTIMLNKKKYQISLLLQMEKVDEQQFRWGIAGVTGLKQTGVYSDKLVIISPVEHEIHFPCLYNFFTANKTLTPGLRSKYNNIDEFSMFVGMVYSGGIQFLSVDEVKFYFMDVPNYVFEIEELGRQGGNSGWLITNFKKVGKDEKIDYVKNLFGIK